MKLNLVTKVNCSCDRKMLFAVFLMFFSCSAVWAQMSTIAGPPFGENVPATSTFLSEPTGRMAMDAFGNLYFAEKGNSRIRKIIPDGTITTIAGTGASIHSGDNGQAIDANLIFPYALAFDGTGNLYIADLGGHRIRKIATNGIITTVAGSGVSGFGGDGGSATASATKLNFPRGVAIDGSGNLYIADMNNHRIRKVSTSGIITTVAGTGIAGYSGDGGQATSTQLNYPTGIAFDGSGNLHIVDQSNHRIRKVATDGTITTIAGTGTNGFSGDGGQAINAQLNSPAEIAFDGSGNLYVADNSNYRIRKIATDGIITTIAGTGNSLFNGDGVAISKNLERPEGLVVDGSGNLYIADRLADRIRKVSNGNMTTIAGKGSEAGFSGENVNAINAQLNFPAALAFNASKTKLYIADKSNHRIRKIENDTITTVAGSGTLGYGGDGASATASTVKLNNPSGVAVDKDGNVYISDSYNNRIRKVGTDGIINTVAGNGNAGFSGDGGSAISAQLNFPKGITIDKNGNLYIVDATSQRIRRVDTNGTISTVAGTGSIGITGDGGLATLAPLFNPTDVAVDDSGNLYINGGNRIRKVDTNGIITTILTGLANNTSLTIDGTGNVFITNVESNDVRIPKADGSTMVVCGGVYGYSGDGGTATRAALRSPSGMELDSEGNFYIADQNNHRIRKYVPFQLTITGLSFNKTYDGTSTANGTGTASLSGILNNETVTLNGTGVTSSFSDKNAGNSKTVTSSGYSIAGIHAFNYKLNPTSTGDISPKTLTLTGVTIADKVYDGTTLAIANGTPSLSGIVAGDAVSLSASDPVTWAFSDKNAGSKTVTATGYSLGGVDAGNYSLDPTATGNITKASQTITFSAVADKLVGDPAFALGAATTASELTVNYSITPANRIDINNGQATIVGAGRVTITASQGGDNNYVAATPVEQSFCINPATPVATASFANPSAPVLTSNAAAGNQWYNGDNLISNAVNSTFTVAQAGVYKVQVKVDDCASAFSNLIPVIVTGDLNEATANIHAWPIPATNSLYIEGLGEEANVKVMSAQGIELNVTQSSNNGIKTVDVSGLSAGMYMMYISDGGKVQVLRFTKTRD